MNSSKDLIKEVCRSKAPFTLINSVLTSVICLDLSLYVFITRFSLAIFSEEEEEKRETLVPHDNKTHVAQRGWKGSTDSTHIT